MELTRENYRAYDAINYSKLSALVDHPSKVNEEKDFSDGLRNGDLLDMFCYDGEDAVHEKYYVSTITQMPSDTIKEIIEASPNYEEGTLIQTARDMGYGASNWKDSTILRKLEENGGAEYMMELENAGDKPIISFEKFTEMQQASNLILNHKFTNRFFGDGWQYQKPMKADLHIDCEDPVTFKGLFDGIKVYEDNKKVIVHDLKYMSGELKYFPSDFMRWKYYIQASLYHDIAAANFRVDDATPYDVEYYNVVYSSMEHKVQNFRIDNSMIVGGRKGFTKASGVPVKGYEELAAELIWHQNKNKWEYPYEVYNNNGTSVIENYGV